MLINTRSKEVFEFPCNRWLATNEDDKQIVRELAVATHAVFNADTKKMEEKKVEQLAQVQYTVSVVTGTVKGAGTDANVSIIVYGSNGDSGERKLDKSKTHFDKFERGQTDVFDITAVDLGELTKVKIWHDDKNLGADWYLDRVEVAATLAGRTKQWTFPCNKWLALDKEDGQISRELPVFIDPAAATAEALRRDQDAKAAVKDLESLRLKRASRADIDDASSRVEAAQRSASLAAKLADLATGGQASMLSTYTVTLVTGAVADADTSAKVFIELFGTETEGKSGKSAEKGSPKILVNTDKRRLARGSTETFDVRALRLSDISRIKISTDGDFDGGSWFCESVQVTIVESGKVFFFTCHNWLSNKEGDKRLERALALDEKKTKQLNAKVVYDVEVYTGKDKNAGTDSRIFLSLFGSKTSVADVPLKSKSDKFDAGTVEKFALELGELSKVRVRNDNTGKTRAGWLLDRIVVRNGAAGTTVAFPCGQWLSDTEGDKQLFRDLQPDDDHTSALQVPVDRTSYKVLVKTGDVFGAGTNANVSVVLFGYRGDSGEHQLTHSATNRNKFERNQLDEFTIESVDLGELTKCRIWHDGAGLGAGWFLESVEVIEAKSQSKYVFPCGRWLDSDKDDKSLVRELVCKEVGEYWLHPTLTRTGQSQGRKRQVPGRRDGHQEGQGAAGADQHRSSTPSHRTMW